MNTNFPQNLATIQLNISEDIFTIKFFTFNLEYIQVSYELIKLYSLNID